MTKRFRVAIIGGGTGGLCLAHGLRQAGVDVAVYERSRTRTERLQGYRVHINPAGAWALHECLPGELWKTFVATAGKSGGTFGFVTEQLKELMFLDEDTTTGAERDAARAHYSVSRITLHQLLSSGLGDVPRYDKDFRRYERTTDGVIRCFFADGTTADADVLVAADGANSRVRKQYLPHAERVDTGVIAIAGKFPLTEQTRKTLPARLSEGPSTVMPSRGCGMFVAPHEFDGEPIGGIGGDDETRGHDEVLFDNTGSYVMWSYAAAAGRYPDASKLSNLDGAALRDLVCTMTKDWHPGLRRLVADSPAESVSLLPIRTSVPIDPWPTTNVTLLGDAIHSMTPFRGIGANTALRDANLLSRSLIDAWRGERELLTAIGDYERKMVDYGFGAVRDSLRSAEQFVSDSVVGRAMFKTVLRFFNAVPPLKRKVFSDHGSE